MKTPARTLTLAVLSLAAPLLAQQPQAVDPSQVPEKIRLQQEEMERKRIAAANAANPPKPVERPVPSVKSTDPEVQAFVKLLTGSFASPAAGETPALSLSTVVVTVDGQGVDNAVYFELARADSPWAPFRQGLWQVWKKSGSLVVRQYDFTGVPATFKAAMTGLWTAPDMFPVLKSSQLVPVADVTLASSSSGNYSGTGTGPTMIDGAFEFTSSWIVTPDTLSFTDRGVDASGKQVWGPAPGAAGPTFKRGNPVAKSERRTGGVVVIDFVSPSASERKLEEWAEAAGVVVGYTDGGAEFYNSNTPNSRTGSVDPYRWTASPQGGIQGWNVGMAGVTQGTVRRLYIPTSMAFGPRGNRNVPPNADLIFSTQVQWVGEPKPPAQPAPTPTPAPAGAAKPVAAGAQAVPASEVPAAVREAHAKQQQEKLEKQQNQPPK